MKTNLFIAALSLVVLAGCSSEDEVGTLVAKNDNVINFTTYVQLLKAVLHHTPLIKFHRQVFREQIDLPDDPRIAIEHAASLIHGDPVLVPALPTPSDNCS